MAQFDARMRRVVGTAGASYLGRFGSAAVVLVTLPMARQALHPELFGVWMMLSALLSFMAFADLGIGNGVLNKITEAQAAGDRAGLRRTLAAGYACTGAVGVTVLLVWFGWSQLGGDPSRLAGTIAAENRSQVMAALTAFAVVMAINIPASLVQRVQLGMQQGYWNGIAQFAAAAVTLAAVPLALHAGAGVAGLVLATIGVQAGVNIANTLVWLHRNRLLRPAEWNRSLHLHTIGALLRTGSLFFVLQLAASFAFQSDAIVITQTLGQAAYGDFAVVQRLFLFISMLTSAAMTGLWPAFGDALARGDRAWTLKTLRRGLLVATLSAALAVATLAAAMPWLLQHWLRAPIQVGGGLVLALGAWTVIDAAASVVAALLNGAGVLRAQMLLAICMAGTAFTAKWLLVPALGTAGATVATIGAYALISVPGIAFILLRRFT